MLKAKGWSKVFTVSPGADVKDIRINVEGARNLKVSDNGELLVEGESGTVKYSKPMGFQEKEGKRKDVSISYNMIDKNTYGFKPGDYDTALPLIIDPAIELEYSTYLGGSGIDGSSGIAVDSSGNAYVTGYTGSTNFPTQNPIQGSNAGGEAYLTKINAAGNPLDYY